jgi:hypothetical protein
MLEGTGSFGFHHIRVPARERLTISNHLMYFERSGLLRGLREP